jgi:hypothetical protein
VSETEDLTRRQWLLRLGEATALVGFAGLVPDAATVLTAQQAQGAIALPPGLYDPAPEHLTHLLAGGGVVVPPPGSQTEYAPPRPARFQPAFLSATELRLVTETTGVFLGAVDRAVVDEVVQWIDLYLQSASRVREAARRLAPEHRAVAVAYYGSDARVRQLETDDPPAFAKAALKWLEGYGSGDMTSRLEALRGLPAASAEKRGYDVLRRETIRGYYTSQAGLKDLNYQGNAYYGACPGCNLA